MKKKQVLFALATFIVASFHLADAQQPGKIPRIGILPPGPISERVHLWDAFRQGLRELGYTEGQNIVIETRHAAMRPALLPDLAANLVLSKVDVIVAAGDPAIYAARYATTTIPIVMVAGADPVGSGLVTSLARPGGNLTGLSALSPELSGKRLQLLTEALPGASRVAVLWNPADPAKALDVRETQAAGQALGVRLQLLEVREPEEFESAFAAMARDRAEALITLGDPLTVSHRMRIVDLAAKSRLPTMYDVREFVEAGGLMAYGPSLADLFRRAAAYVDKILKGGKPGTLPVEQPMKFELIINIKTAKALGLTIPQSVLFLADQVIQ
jgi:putative tryptophan/tyrosine transport system substrate-binding protein